MESPTIHLNDEADLRPVEVDPHPLKPMLRFGRRQTGPVHETKELALELGLRYTEPRPVDDGPERGAWSAGLGCCCS